MIFIVTTHFLVCWTNKALESLCGEALTVVLRQRETCTHDPSLGSSGSKNENKTKKPKSLGPRVYFRCSPPPLSLSLPPSPLLKNSVSQGSPGWHQASNPPASYMLGLQACVTTPGNL